MNLERRRRRIRDKARATHLSLAPLALLALPLAIYLSYGVCEEADSTASFAACDALRFLPFLPTLAGLAMLALIAWDLAEVGRAAHAAKTGARPARGGLRHALHGYRVIDESHRRRVLWVVAHVAAVTLAIAAWIAYEAHVSTH